MKNQQQMNADWMRTMPTNVGPVTFLAPPPTNSRLRRPYQHELSLADCRSLEVDLKLITAHWKQKLQCALLELKAVKYGRRIHIFALGFRPGLCGDDRIGLTQDQWQEFSESLTARLRQSLGDDVSVYIEPWSDTNKFQLRFETYILYRP